MYLASTRRDFLQRLAVLGAAGFVNPFFITSSVEPQNSPPPPAPPDTTWKATIIDTNEPGERLVVAGKVFAPDRQNTVPGVFVYAYNTDQRGNYASDGNVYPPRLKGYMKTDADGRFELHTILPGHYPGMHIPVHVHFILWGGGYPVQWVDELQFEGDHYLTDAQRRQSESRGDFATIRPLTRDSDGVYHCSINLLLQEKSTYPGH